MNVLELTEPRGGISNFGNCSHCSGWEDKDGGSAVISIWEPGRANCGELEVPRAQLRRGREHGEDTATSGHTAQSREKEKEIPWHLLLLPLPPIDWTLLKM